MSVPRLVVMISGSGTNLQALIDADNLNAEIVLVISNRRDAYGLVRAQEAEIPTIYFPLKPYKEDGRGREQYDLDLADLIADAKPDLIVLAGWMHVFSPPFLDRFPNRVINLHPALPGTFVGTHGIERAFEAWQKGEITQSGCMMHYVVPEVDAGAVIGMRVVPFRAGDTLESYAERLHAAEHELIVESTIRVLTTKFA